MVSARAGGRQQTENQRLETDRYREPNSQSGAILLNYWEATIDKKSSKAPQPTTSNQGSLRDILVRQLKRREEAEKALAMVERLDGRYLSGYWT